MSLRGLAHIAKHLQHAFLLLGPLLQLVSLNPEETVLLCLTHMIVLEYLLYVVAVYQYMRTLAVTVLLSF